MAIVDTRIDDRLVHGQVCSYWVPQYGVERIVVVDDLVAKDEMRKSVLRLACPDRCKLSIFDAEKAADKFKRHIDRGVKVLILCNRPQPILEMARSGFQVDYVTVGNMSSKDGARQIANTAFVSQDEWNDFCSLARLGVTIYNQMVPSNPREDITQLFLQ